MIRYRKDSCYFPSMISMCIYLILLLLYVPITNSFKLVETRGGEQAIVGEILDPVKQPRYDMTGNDVRRKDLNNRNAAEDESRRWPGGVVPYVFGNITQEAIQAVKDAIADFDNFTCIKWIARTKEDNYVLFMKGVGCQSDFGRVGGAQELSLGDGCQNKPTAIHEMMHSIGFDHEHNSIDRDKYVKINWENIQKGEEYQFFKGDGVMKRRKTKTFDVPYCYTSIMHYSVTSFSLDEKKPSMTILADVDSSVVGQRKGFSDCDILKISKSYQCSGKDSLAPEVKPTCQPVGKPAMKDGEEKTSGSFLMKCSAPLNGSWSIDAVACIDDNGKQRQAGDTWDDGRYIEKCESTATGGVKLVTVGCLDKSGKPRAKNEKWAEGNFLRQCLELEDSGVLGLWVACRPRGNSGATVTSGKPTPSFGNVRPKRVVIPSRQ